MINKLIWVGILWIFSNSKSPGHGRFIVAKDRVPVLPLMMWMASPEGKTLAEWSPSVQAQRKEKFLEVTRECHSRCGSIVEDHCKILVTHRLARNAATEAKLFFSENIGKTLRRSQWCVAVCKHLHLWLKATWAWSLRDCGWVSYFSGKVHSLFHKREACFLEREWWKAQHGISLSPHHCFPTHCPSYERGPCFLRGLSRLVRHSWHEKDQGLTMLSRTRDPNTSSQGP